MVNSLFCIQDHKRILHLNEFAVLQRGPPILVKSVVMRLNAHVAEKHTPTHTTSTHTKFFPFFFSGMISSSLGQKKTAKPGAIVLIFFLCARLCVSLCVCHVTHESADNHIELMRDRTHQLTVMRLAKAPQTADCHLLLSENSHSNSLQPSQKPRCPQSIRSLNTFITGF